MDSNTFKQMEIRGELFLAALTITVSQMAADFIFQLITGIIVYCTSRLIWHYHKDDFVKLIEKIKNNRWL